MSADTNGHDYVVGSDANEPFSAGTPNCNPPPPAPLPEVKFVGKLPRTGAGTGADAMPCPLPMPMAPPPAAPSTRPGSQSQPKNVVMGDVYDLPAPADERLAGDGRYSYPPASRSHKDKLLPPLEEDRKVRSQSNSISRMEGRLGQRSPSPPSFPHQPLVPAKNSNATEDTRHKPGPSKFGNFGNRLGREPRFLSKREAQVSVCTCSTSMQNKMLHGRHDSSVQQLCDVHFLDCVLVHTSCVQTLLLGIGW